MTLKYYLKVPNNAHQLILLQAMVSNASEGNFLCTEAKRANLGRKIQLLLAALCKGLEHSAKQAWDLPFVVANF